MLQTVIEAIGGSAGCGRVPMHASVAMAAPAIAAMAIDTMDIFNVGNATYLALPVTEVCKGPIAFSLLSLLSFFPSTTSA